MLLSYPSKRILLTKTTDSENDPADPTSGNKNTAKLKLDEAKKAFDETENKLKN